MENSHQLKLPKETPIHKNKGSSSGCSNYLPLLVLRTAHVAKAMRVMQEQLKAYFYKLLIEIQLCLA